MKHIALLLLLQLALCLNASGTIPMGWCTQGEGMSPIDVDRMKSIRLQASENASQAISEAVKQYDVIILDGSGGDFVLEKRIVLADLKDKAIIGIHHATLRTKWEVTDSIRYWLNQLQLNQLSTHADGTVYTLSNGRRVKEHCEAAIRQLLIDSLHDSLETYQEAGCWTLQRCHNIRLQNLRMIGPGAIDVGGADLITISDHSTNIWVDSCQFIDGMDGNADCNGFANFITFSHCLFDYTCRSYNHKNSNLIGSSDNVNNNGEDCLNITFYYCTWGANCDQRMPMCRFGTIHLYRCEWLCPQATRCVNARKMSSVKLEHCRFAEGTEHAFVASADAAGYQMVDCRVGGKRLSLPHQKKITLPYHLTRASR